MLKFKVGDVFEFHPGPDSAWYVREGSIGIILACDSYAYDVNWIIDTAPHLKNRRDHPAYDNHCSLDSSVLITRAEVTDDDKGAV